MLLEDTSATVPGSLSLLPTAEERVGLGRGESLPVGFARRQ